MANNQTTDRKPFFMDVTLRDGNQALKNPWNLEQKQRVFRALLDLGVQGIEAGFASASDTDFNACYQLASACPDDVVIASLSRAVKSEIVKSWDAIGHAPDPRIHIVLPVSRLIVENVLQASWDKVRSMAYESVAFAKDLTRGKGSVQFSAEHFGDCGDDMDLALSVIQEAVRGGADVINLPNTVERFRPSLIAAMVREARSVLPGHVVLSVHNHNDMGMATAATVESFYMGATQLEVSLNGLGERAGNTSLYEVACVLYNSGTAVPLNFGRFYETSGIIAGLSGIPVHEKAPLIGGDIISHRSGIHQDGVEKTMKQGQGAYRPFDFSLLGRVETDRVEFTSQSGKSAVKSILASRGIDITTAEAEKLQPFYKILSEQKGGSLTGEEMADYFVKTGRN